MRAFRQLLFSRRFSTRAWFLTFVRTWASPLTTWRQASAGIMRREAEPAATAAPKGTRVRRPAGPDRAGPRETGPRSAAATRGAGTGESSAAAARAHRSGLRTRTRAVTGEKPVRQAVAARTELWQRLACGGSRCGHLVRPCRRGQFVAVPGWLGGRSGRLSISGVWVTPRGGS